MKFGLFYELQLPKQYDDETWDEEAEFRIYNEMLDQVELADSLALTTCSRWNTTSSRSTHTPRRLS